MCGGHAYYFIISYTIDHFSFHIYILYTFVTFTFRTIYRVFFHPSGNIYSSVYSLYNIYFMLRKIHQIFMCAMRLQTRPFVCHRRINIYIYFFYLYNPAQYLQLEKRPKKIRNQKRRTFFVHIEEKEKKKINRPRV